MYFVDLIKNKFKDKELMIFVDMDGVIADYDICDNPYNYRNKRPVITNINVIKKLSELSNVEIKILSICKKDKDIVDKCDWLNDNCNFIIDSNKNILSKETYPNILSKDLKLNFLRNINTNKQIILIDDDNEILHYIKDNLKNVIVFQDSSLID